MHHVEPNGVKGHWYGFEDVDVPFLVRDNATKRVTLTGVRDTKSGKGLNCAEDTSNEDEG